MITPVNEWEDAKIRAPMPAKIVSIKCEVGDSTERGDALIVIESMKMETTLNAPCAGIVQTVHVEEGVLVGRGDCLIEFEEGPRK